MTTSMAISEILKAYDPKKGTFALQSALIKAGLLNEESWGIFLKKISWEMQDVRPYEAVKAALAAIGINDSERQMQFWCTFVEDALALPIEERTDSAA